MASGTCAHPGLHDLVLLQFRELLPAKLDRAAVALVFPQIRVEHRGLAGAVRADDGTRISVLLDIEGEVVDRLEAVERHRERLDREQKFLGLMTDKA